MKRTNIYIFSIFGIIAILTVLAVLIPDNSKTPTRVPIANPQSVYQNAVKKLNADTQPYCTEISKKTAIDDEVFHETRSQKITKSKSSDSDITITVDELLTIGNHSASITEVYHGGTVYITLDGSNFRSNTDYKSYVSRYAPLLPIDPTLYGTVTGYVENGQSIIEFTNPETTEKWLWDEKVTFESATGRVTISKSGELLSSVYTVSYSLGNNKIITTVTTSPNDQISAIPVPEDEKNYTLISSSDAPRLLEKACGYLMEASSISATYTDYIECTAFEDWQSRTIQIDAVSVPDWSSRTHTTVTYLDHSKAGSETTVDKNELFLGGKYTICIDNTAPVANDTVTQDMMRTECHNTLIGTIMLPSQIVDAEISESETTYDIIYTANEAFSEQMRTNACETLYQNPDILSDQTESYVVDTAICYLRLDKATGLPVSSGFRYVGTYTMDALPYRLEFRADQEYTILNDTAKETITKEGNA